MSYEKKMINEWEKLKYVDPSVALSQIRDIQILVANSNLNDKEKNLRTHLLKKHYEGWVAALFCYGIGQRLKTTVYVCPYENSDYDAVSVRRDQEEILYTPIQIKEVVPESINPDTNLNNEMEKWGNKYKGTDVVVHLNRNSRFDLYSVVVPQKLQCAGLWLVGANRIDQNKWFLFGNMMQQPTISIFDYPLKATGSQLSLG